MTSPSTLPNTPLNLYVCDICGFPDSIYLSLYHDSFINMIFNHFKNGKGELQHCLVEFDSFHKRNIIS